MAGSNTSPQDQPNRQFSVAQKEFKYVNAAKFEPTSLAVTVKAREFVWYKKK